MPEDTQGHPTEGAAGAEEPEFSERRRELVRRAIDAWKKQLIDLGGRNNLLNYRDLRSGTLDLSAADPRGLVNLLAGKPVPLGRLLGDPEALPDARKRARAIYKKALELYEERGIETLFISIGLATWEPGSLSLKHPNAPVLLRPAQITPTGAAQDDFVIELTGEMSVSETLKHVLSTEFGCRFDETALELDGVIDTPAEVRAALDWVKAAAHRAPGFSIVDRTVLGTFSYTKLPMVIDLGAAEELLVEHELISAIAGDDEAREALRDHYASITVDPSEPDQVPFSDEFLVLDADSSQNWAINAVNRGMDLIVRGPPGTGKSQTISNLIATLAARGKRVLFVAEKRAAIDAVVERLDMVGLHELVFDIHGGVAGRRQVAAQLADSITRTRLVAHVDNTAEMERLERRRAELCAHTAAMHDTREPWHRSVFELMTIALRTRPYATELRVRGEPLRALDDATFRLAREELREFAGLGGFRVRTSGSPWADASVTTPEDARATFETLDRLRSRELADAADAYLRAAQATQVQLPEQVSQWGELLQLWLDTDAYLNICGDEVFDLDLDELLNALEPASRGAGSRLLASMFSSEYRKARGEVTAFLTEKANPHDIVARARDLLARWRAHGLPAGTRPSVPPELDRVVEAHNALEADLAELARAAGRDRLDDRPEPELRSELDRMYSDQPTLMKLPELHRLNKSLQQRALGELVDELHGWSEPTADACVACLEHLWAQSILAELRLSDQQIGAFDAHHQSEIASDYRVLDHQHIETTAERILRLWAQRTVAARDAYPDQDALLRQQAARKRKLMPFRELFAATKDLILELKPCWVMSPLVVSQVLPAERLFDVVIFDEASQVQPADAMPSIARGARLVIAGDEKQLPPTTFFMSGTGDDDSEDETLAAPVLDAVSGFESILDGLRMLLPFRTLEWHYRSRDERLIAFSNANFYDWNLTTFPGIGGDEPIKHIHVPWQPGLPGDEDSATAEVRRVVELVLDHATQRPEHSLGVIAMGIKHANRIETALFEALRDSPDLEDFFSETNEERFFIKNLERVQGDERDAIILSIGYGKNAEGRLLYRFGPINLEGGERRLNVAVTRARRSLTVVSSFGSSDMDPNKVSSRGPSLLRNYLQFAESNGANLGDRIIEQPRLNAFEIDVRDTLALAGIETIPQLGVSGYRIDFAVTHPLEPGKFVLALECDGASYHSVPTTRDRDRLRQEHLERLGWTFHRIWSTDWFTNKHACVERLRAEIDQALEREKDGATVTPEPRPRAPRAAAPPTPARRPRPPVPRYRSIGAYSNRELVAIASWIESDTLPRTEEELLVEVMNDLGFIRKGKNIVARIERAIREARRATHQHVT